MTGLGGRASWEASEYCSTLVWCPGTEDPSWQNHPGSGRHRTCSIQIECIDLTAISSLATLSLFMQKSRPSVQSFWPGAIRPIRHLTPKIPSPCIVCFSRSKCNLRPCSLVTLLNSRCLLRASSSSTLGNLGAHLTLPSSMASPRNSAEEPCGGDMRPYMRHFL